MLHVRFIPSHEVENDLDMSQEFIDFIHKTGYIARTHDYPGNYW